MDDTQNGPGIGPRPTPDGRADAPARGLIRRVRGTLRRLLPAALSQQAQARMPPATDPLFRAAFAQMRHAALLLDANGVVVACNAGLRALLALPDHVGRPGSTLAALTAHLPHGAAPGRPLPSAQAAPAADQHGADADGPAINTIWAPLGAAGWLCLCEAIPQRRAPESPHVQPARQDLLTGLPNRLALAEALTVACARAQAGEAVWVHCLDLDRFKQINDAHGHGVGDAVLHEVARRLRAAVREGDVLAHLGSDEFVIVQTGGGAVDAPATLARRLVEVLSHPYLVGGETLLAGASIGVAPMTATERDPDAVLRRADLALGRAKLDGRGTWRFFDAAMDAAARRRRELEADLREALPAEQFELFYQPLVSVRDRRVCGLEALIRWRHPVRGLIAPTQFIPLAEELGLIVPIGAWVLRSACAAAAHWPGSVRLAVNLSPAQFLQPGLLETVRAALAESGLPAARLELEITENVLLADSQDTLDVLHALRAMGVRISMDDFGTGYASLSYLRSFPFDKLKIDKSFVSGHDQGGENAVIVRTIAALGRSLGMATTAEGVETLDQLERLVADGCTEMQGYFFSPPCPASDVPRLLVEIAVRGACATEDDGAGVPAVA